MTFIHYVIIYFTGFFLSPFVYWMLWFLATLSRGYLAGDHLDPGDLNYYNSFKGDTDGSWSAFNFFMGVLAWPLGYLMAAVAFIITIIYSLIKWISYAIDSYWGESRSGDRLDFPRLTEALNKKNQRRNKKA